MGVSLGISSLVAFLLLLFVAVSKADHWALIVAGSNGWYNYRHQADACHAYQILHKNGIPDENIVVMMYDDIANHRQNPTPGKIINKPNGPDVYHGVPKDYTGEDVTPENFLKILKGQKNAMNGIGSGKVINSGPNDNVFVYFTDHGAPNIIAFPSSELHAQDLNDAIKFMHENKRYKKMVFYIEACESGSMFDQGKLSGNISVFATTAANGAESSYACYYDDARQTYLGDVYSIKWLEDSDVADFTKETLEQQFKIVKEETNTSHVMQFGDLSISTDVIGKYQGELKVPRRFGFSENNEKKPKYDAVPSPDVPLWIMHHQLNNQKLSINERQKVLDKMYQEQKLRLHIHRTMEGITERLVDTKEDKEKVLKTKASPVELKCYKDTVTHFRRMCFDFNKYEHALRHVYVLANLCDLQLESSRIKYAIESHCNSAKFKTAF